MSWLSQFAHEKFVASSVGSYVSKCGPVGIAC